MPLIDLKTDLKSLKFGKDRPGGGSSNQPYIQKEIPDGDSSNIFNTGGIDSILRGGLMAPIKAANDTSRLAQMFFDLKSPNGLLFTAKQNALSRTAVKTEASKGPGYGGGNVNAGIYTPLNTLAQAPVGFLGTHLNQLGLDPTGLSDTGLNNYFDVVKSQEKEDNRLINLTSNEDEVNILQYSGGPGSVLGVGDTSIKYADQRTGDKNPQSITNPTTFYSGSFKISQDLNYNNLLGVSNVEGLEEFDTSINSDGQLTRLYGRVGENSTLSKSNPTSQPLSGSGAYQSINNLSQVNNNNQLGASVAEGLTPEDNALNGNGQFTDKFYGRIGENSTLSKNNPTNQPLTGSNAYQSTHPLPIVNFNNLLGASTSEGLTNTENGINSEGQFTIRYYGRIGENSTLSKNNPTPTKLSGNKAYQSGIRNSETNRTGLFMGNLDYAKLTKNGSSQTYINLTKDLYTGEAINNNFYQGDSFNVYTQGNTFPEISALQSANNSLTYTQEQIIQSTPVSKGGIEGDFRYPLTKDLPSSTITSKGYNPDELYSKIQKNQRVNLGNPGTKKDILKYSVSPTALDAINASSIYESEGPNHKDKKNDLAKFSIGIQNTNNTKSQFMNFRAFINSFNDQYSADWGSTQYIGRGDKFYNYKGFERTISMGWTVYAQSKAELIPMYKKLNYLASSLAPNYSSAGYMQGNLARLTVGGYLYNQLGIITGITYDVPQESPWEIGITEELKDDESVKELPFMINVTGFNFIPIQDFVPQKGGRFIALTDGQNNNYDS